MLPLLPLLPARFYMEAAPEFANPEKVDKIIASYKRKAAKKGAGAGSQAWQGLLWAGFADQGTDPRALVVR